VKRKACKMERFKPRESVCVCVCVKERGRKRERERERLRERRRKREGKRDCRLGVLEFFFLQT